MRHRQTHTLKTDPQPFEDLLSGKKTSEVRNDDRNFEIGDTLIFRETRFTAFEMSQQNSPLEYTGRTQWRTVSHVQRGYGLQPGHVALSFLMADSVSAMPDVTAEMRRNSDRYKQLQAMMGYWQDGSEQTVTLFQDDATRTVHLKIGDRMPRRYYGDSLSQVIEQAAAIELKGEAL